MATRRKYRDLPISGTGVWTPWTKGPGCKDCLAHYGDDDICDEGKPVGSPHRVANQIAKKQKEEAAWAAALEALTFGL